MWSRVQGGGAPRSPRLPGGTDGSAPGTRGAQSIQARLEERLRRLAAPLTARAAAEVSRIQRRFHSPLHSEWLAAVLGIVLGVSFSVCFLTGMVDYLVQHPPYWFHLPVRPINFFRVTEGVHVLTGIIAIPLLLAKLWVVYPNFSPIPSP